MSSILIGLETEYGFTVEGRGVEDRIEDSMALVREISDECFVGWNYRCESPRADLRGFNVEKLNFDPEDAKFDKPTDPTDSEVVRSDRVLSNGARFYNDHGHPEYATPECRMIHELLLNDVAGDSLVRSAAAKLESRTGTKVRIYKNNTDYRGASFGSHESYLVPRSLGYERIFKSVTPVLVARQIFCGAGKVGSERGQHCDFQISQRADFLTESSAVDTLFARPVFNTRDEPHADHRQWIRLHVISGDSNRLAFSTQIKFALVKLAIWLEQLESAPKWEISNPPRSFQSVSRDLTCNGRIELNSGNWTTATEIIESYVENARRFLDSREPEISEAIEIGARSIELIHNYHNGGEELQRHVDWAAKLAMMRLFLDSEGGDWANPSLISYDLAYHALDPEESLLNALLELDHVEPVCDDAKAHLRRHSPQECTRALARSIAVRKWLSQIETLSWGQIIFRSEKGLRNVSLPPDVMYSSTLETAKTVEEFCEHIEKLT